jgi:hypothetical protein
VGIPNESRLPMAKTSFWLQNPRANEKWLPVLLVAPLISQRGKRSNGTGSAIGHASRRSCKRPVKRFGFV